MFSLLHNAEARSVVLHCLFLPILVAAIVLLIARVADRARSVASGTALAFGAVLVLGAYQDVLPLRPGDFAWQWLPTVTLSALAVGWITDHLPWRGLRLLLCATCAGLAGWWLVPPALQAITLWAIPALSVVILAHWVLFDRLARTTPTAQVPLAMALPFLAAFVIILHAHCGRLAEEALIVAGGLTGMALVARWVRVECTGAVPGAAVLLPGVLLAGQTETYSDVPCSAFVIAALAPLVLGVTLLPGLHRWPRARLALLRLVLLLVPLAYAVFLATSAESIDLE